MTTKFTPGPWSWEGEDYRGDWGWQMLVGPNGEGLIVGQDKGGEPCKHLRAHMPVDPSLCQTGLIATGERVECVHVFSKANAALIASAPDLYRACEWMESILTGWLSSPDRVMSVETANRWKAAREALKRAKGEA